MTVSDHFVCNFDVYASNNHVMESDIYIYPGTLQQVVSRFGTSSFGTHPGCQREYIEYEMMIN